MPSAPGPQLPGFIGCKAGSAEEATCLSLPPRVDNDGFILTNGMVIPAPDIRLNRFTYRGHVLEMVVVFGRLIGANLAQHANSRWSGMEDGHTQPFSDAPGSARIGIGWHTFVHYTCRSQRQWAIHDIGVI